MLTAPLLALSLLGGCGDDAPARPEQRDAQPRREKTGAARRGTAGGQGSGSGPAAATYTSLQRSGCTSREEEELGAPSIAIHCPGHGGYGVRIDAHDHGSELDLTRRGSPLGLRYRAPGWMASVTEGQIEWRSRGDAAPHALVFRVHWVDPNDSSGGSQSTLIVTRIEGDTACEIGQTTSNTRARALADERSKRCG